MAFPYLKFSFGSFGRINNVTFHKAEIATKKIWIWNLAAVGEAFVDSNASNRITFLVIRNNAFSVWRIYSITFLFGIVSTIVCLEKLWAQLFDTHTYAYNGCCWRQPMHIRIAIENSESSVILELSRWKTQVFINSFLCVETPMRHAFSE